MTARVLRTMLFVPAANWRMITGATEEGTDAVIVDLEDACPQGEKETGRVFARDSAPTIKATGTGAFVRVNSLDTGLTETDLDYVVTPGLDGVMLPKTESKEDIATCDRLLRRKEEIKGMEPGSTSIIPLIETPKGVLAASEIATASKRVIALSFGSGDYSREIGAGMGVTRLSSEDRSLMTYHPRCCTALAARAAGILAIDAPFFGLVIDTKGLVEETRRAKLLGFTGKLLTHPRHVEPVNQVYTPPEEEIKLAREVITAYEQARAQGLGATSVGGRMIDYASYRRAAELLALANTLERKTAGQPAGA